MLIDAHQCSVDKHAGFRKVRTVIPPNPGQFPAAVEGWFAAAPPIVMAYSVEGRRISSRLTKISREGNQRDVSLTTIRKHADDFGRCIGKMGELTTELTEKNFRAMKAITDKYYIL